MKWFVGVGMTLGLALVVYGALCMRTGWAFPWARSRVTRPWAHGLGAVFIGVPCLVQGLFYFGITPSLSWEIRFFGSNAFTLAGLGPLAVSQMLPSKGTSPRR
ncbi:hypothetical protein [Streptomyces sp. NPDC001435]|uniref:hypothetical protein n=1 Tax=unclassified Streptomyces TaxID=2593676 RepID=UPI00368D7261